MGEGLGLGLGLGLWLGLRRAVGSRRCEEGLGVGGRGWACVGVRGRAWVCVGVRASASRQAGCALPPRGDGMLGGIACRIGLRCRGADAEGRQGAGRCGAVFFRHARARWRRACFLWREAKRAKGRPISRAASKQVGAPRRPLHE